MEKTVSILYPGIKDLLGTSSSCNSFQPGLTSYRAFGPPEDLDMPAIEDSLCWLF